MASRSRLEPSVRPSFVSTQVAEARRYFLDLDPAPTRGITVVCGGCERMRPDYLVERASFPFLAVEFVAEGEGALTLVGRDYRLRPGTAFAYGPRAKHVIRNEPARPMLKYYVDFIGEAAARLLAKSPLARWRAVQLSAPQEVADLFELLQREGASESRHGAQLCAALLPVLLMKISERAVPYAAAEPRALETYQRARRTIEQRFLTLRSAKEAAAACHLDPAYLSRLFQRFAHTTPWRFITKLKMNRAASLLMDERLLVKEAADAIGFADAFHFSRAFKRHYGLPPERFARRGETGPPWRG
jgi:AraC-like DNA-binding protein